MSLKLIVPSWVPAQARRQRLMECRQALFLCQMRKVACQAAGAIEAVIFYRRLERALRERVNAWKAVQL